MHTADQLAGHMLYQISSTPNITTCCICILQHSPISVWFYPYSYICNCLKMPKKSQINEYSDSYKLHKLLISLFASKLCIRNKSKWRHVGPKIIHTISSNVYNIKMTFKATSLKKSSSLSNIWYILVRGLWNPPSQPLTIRPICTPIGGIGFIKRSKRTSILCGNIELIWEST